MECYFVGRSATLLDGVLLCWTECYFVGRRATLLDGVLLCWTECYFVGRSATLLDEVLLCFMECYFVGWSATLLEVGKILNEKQTELNIYFVIYWLHHTKATFYRSKRHDQTADFDKILVQIDTQVDQLNPGHEKGRFVHPRVAHQDVRLLKDQRANIADGQSCERYVDAILVSLLSEDENVDYVSNDSEKSDFLSEKEQIDGC
ncbi:hypothetical protein Btru_057520 [Bulinus truncatus]|nr:hypothetical protein Btru_057520 [Bulinus truncatus]